MDTDNVDLTPEQMEANAAAAPKAPKRKKLALSAPAKAPAAPKAQKRPATAPKAAKAPKVPAATKKAPGKPQREPAAPKPAKAPVVKRVRINDAAVGTKAAAKAKAEGKSNLQAGTAAHTAMLAEKGPTKADIVIGLLMRPAGATLAELGNATNWQAHSVRGFLAGTLKKKGHVTENEKVEGRGRVYRLTASGRTTSPAEEAI